MLLFTTIILLRQCRFWSGAVVEVNLKSQDRLDLQSLSRKSRRGGLAIINEHGHWSFRCSRTRTPFHLPCPWYWRNVSRNTVAACTAQWRVRVWGKGAKSYLRVSLSEIWIVVQSLSELAHFTSDFMYKWRQNKIFKDVKLYGNSSNTARDALHHPPSCHMSTLTIAFAARSEVFFVSVFSGCSQLDLSSD